MLLNNLNVLRGPNFWSVQQQQLVVLHLDLQETLSLHTALIPDLLPKLQELLSGLCKRTYGRQLCSALLSLPPGQVLGEMVMAAALELQNCAGANCHWGAVHATGKPGEYQAAFIYEEEECGRIAGNAAVALVSALLNGQFFDTAPVVEAIRAAREEYRLGPSTYSLYAEARRRGIPVLRLDDSAYLQFGYGARQKRAEATISSDTSAIAVDKAGDKHATKQLLTAAFVPVPRGEVIRNVESLEEVIATLDFPIVVKPLDGHQGKGASVNIRTLEAAREAFALATLYSPRVVVEKYIHGHDFRALVINNRFVAAARRSPAAVTGDGVHSIAQLVEIVNRDPRRGTGHGNVLTRITIDQASLDLIARKGYTLDSVPPVLRLAVVFRCTASPSAGTESSVYPLRAMRSSEAWSIVMRVSTL
ncbi:MAG: ATP-grasp domain-containing protein, partial [Chitinophagaceae bacterium]